MLRGETVGIFHYGLIVDGPLTLLCFTGAYACRGLRLVVMYHPDMRARWGKHLKQHTVVKGMALLFVIMEILLWSATAAFGLTRYERGPHSVSRSRRGERSLWLWIACARKYSDFVPMHHHAQVKWKTKLWAAVILSCAETATPIPICILTRPVCDASVAGVSRVFLVLDTLLTITTWIVLAGKLRKADDLFRVSQEIQFAGCCMLAAKGKHFVLTCCCN